MKFKILIILIFSLSGFSQNSSKYSNEFLNIGVDAKSISMSKAVVSNIDDVNASYWNPAGLIGVENSQISIMHSNYFANIANYNYLAYAKKIDRESAIGFSMIRFGVDNILDTTQLIDSQGNIDYDRIELFSAADYAFLFSYARKNRFIGINYGINAKVLRRVIGEFANSWGFGFDFGIQYQSKNGWYFGIMGRDITTTFNTWSFDDSRLNEIQNAITGQNQTLPQKREISIPSIQLGLSKDFYFENDYSLLAAFDLFLMFDETNDILSTSIISINPALGLEIGYIDLVFLRIGAGNFQKELDYSGEKNLSFQPNFGIGFNLSNFEISYALTDIGDQSTALYSNIFSIKFDIFNSR